MFVVVTKIDMCPPNVLQETMRLLSRVLKSPGCRKIPVLVQTEDDVITSAANFTSERLDKTEGGRGGAGEEGGGREWMALVWSLHCLQCLLMELFYFIFQH